MPASITEEANARTIDEEFVDLVCGESDLLAAEFDAIIAAEWPDPPASVPHRDAAGRQPERGRSGRRRAATPAHPEQKDALGGEARRRQRSPPKTSTSHRDRKAGDRHT